MAGRLVIYMGKYASDLFHEGVKPFPLTSDNLYTLDRQQIHPSEQVDMAREIARKINSGINILLITHAEHIIKELNIMIMLNNDYPEMPRIAKEHGYDHSTLLDATAVEAWEKDSPKLVEKLSVTQEHGIEAPSLDRIISQQNHISECIIYREF
jgi:Arp2/3 complex, 34 kD subunit p34-Arc